MLFINYEECKYVKTLAQEGKIYGYSLTMRNVNANRPRSNLVTVKCYSLTMRNVNKWITLHPVLSSQLFINYEECKCYFDDSNLALSNCYSLTMRNVNMKHCRVQRALIIVIH